jgi:hypothetical protein
MVTICRDPSPHHAFCNTEFRRKELIAPFASEVLGVLPVGRSVVRIATRE